MPNNKEFVKFAKVDKSYDGKVLVVNLNLDIAEGELLPCLDHLVQEKQLA